MIDTQSQAARAFYREVADFAARATSTTPALRYWVTPSDIRDATMISQRVYGRRDEYLAVVAAAGVNTLEEPIPQRELVLPTEQRLAEIKRRTGFESREELREGFGPIWVVS